jgi:hypothetical protein
MDIIVVGFLQGRGEIPDSLETELLAVNAFIIDIVFRGFILDPLAS